MRVLRLLLIGLVLAAASAGRPALAQADLSLLEPVRVNINQIESGLRRGGISLNTLLDFSQRLGPIRDDLRERIADLEPRAAQLDARLKQLGPAPGKDAPPEPVTIAAERQRLTEAFSEVDAALKQARLLAARADQLNTAINDKRRSVYAKELLEQSSSVLSPFFWVEVARALPAEAVALKDLIASWLNALGDGAGWLTLAAAILIGAMMTTCLIILMQWWERHAHEQSRLSRLSMALAALGVFARAALTVPLVIVLFVQAVESFGLRSQGWDDLTTGLVIAVVIAAFGRGVALAVLAPQTPQRRLVTFADDTAQALARHLTWASRWLGLMVFLLLVHKATAAPRALTDATHILIALGIGALLLNLLWRSAGMPSQSEAGAAGNLWIRGVVWLIVIAIAAAMVLGYAGLAAFLAERTIATVSICGMLFLLFVAADALFTEALSEDSTRARTLAHHLGIHARQIALLGMVLSGFSFLVLVLIGLVLIIGPWEVTASDFFEGMRNVVFGVRIGEINLSLGGIMLAVLVMLLILFVTRLVQSWLATRLLPRTELEPSLQQSIATIAGYIGVITAIVLTLAQLGIDLQKIALIAGALSVGIGFGLQSIVSNFVSGIILLAERPIRVGDLIAVKDQEGKVRRISVRATEIETGERSSVLVPNSELITGIVKNKTRGDLTALTTIPLRVRFSADPEKVREILLDCAREHSQVMSEPKPQTFLASFGDSGLEFKLNVVLRDVSQEAATTSDLRFAILKRLAEAGIRLAYPQRELRWHEPNAKKAASAPKKPRKR